MPFFINLEIVNNIKLFTTAVYKVEYNGRKPIVNTTRKLQLTVVGLSAIVNGFEPGYMIIPIPLYKGKNAIDIVDYKKTTIFDACGSIYAKKGNDWDYLIESARQDLPTNNNFKAEIIVNFGELVKIANIIKIPRETLKVMGNYYSKKFAFIVCTMNGSANYMPIAYVHELPRKSNKLYLPLRILNPNQEVVNEHEQLCIYEDDEFVRHAKARLRPTDDRACNVDRGMTIYVLKEVTARKLGRDGVHVEKGRSSKVAKAITRKLLPKSVTYAAITDLNKLLVGNNYKLNADLYV